MAGDRRLPVALGHFRHLCSARVSRMEARTRDLLAPETGAVSQPLPVHLLLVSGTGAQPSPALWGPSCVDQQAGVVWGGGLIPCPLCCFGTSHLQMPTDALVPCRAPGLRPVQAPLVFLVPLAALPQDGPWVRACSPGFSVFRRS